MQASSLSKIRISSFIVICCLTVALTIACASRVIYRVNPDSPGKMSKEEARSAIKQTLATMEKSFWIRECTFQDDSFRVSWTSSRAGTAMHSDVSSLSDVTPGVMKEEDHFSVRMNVGDAYAFPLYWKSEGDAKLFVDAVHALKKAR